MRAAFKMTRLMVSESTAMLTDLSMRGTGKMIGSTGMVQKLGLMEQNTKGST